ncbi:hypothetical protein [Frankia canadensis]|nr:hypothetical protein [Frankia canadensis]
MITFGTGGGLDPDALMFGVVRFQPGDGRQVRDVFGAFDSPAAADLFVVERRWTDDYQVSALRLAVPEALRPPAGSRLALDHLAARYPNRRRRP